jgi:hypothetical protein
MIEFYPEIRLAHILAVAASGALFFIRGFGSVAGAGWPRAAPLRFGRVSASPARILANARGVSRRSPRCSAG